jgi:CDP-glucose 4,6-dehydratase
MSWPYPLEMPWIISRPCPINAEELPALIHTDPGRKQFRRNWARLLWEFGMEYSGPWNFGPNDTDVKPVSQICDYLTKRWGEGARWQLDHEIHPHENTLLKLDCSKARQSLRWQPKLNLERSLELIVEWFKAYQNGDDMQLVTNDQIRRFEAIS